MLRNYDRRTQREVDNFLSYSKQWSGCITTIEVDL